MNQTGKDKLLSEAHSHVALVQGHLEKKTQQLSSSVARLQHELKSRLSSGEALNLRTLLRQQQETLSHFQALYPSPYFVRCDIRFSDEERVRTLYFAKFLFAEENIYSWISPAATLRFESPGHFSYPLPGGQQRLGELFRKDQFMIVGGKIIFMAAESDKYSRTLVHQEFLARRKVDFVLPEIVEEMEKAQDEVIRAGYRGPLLISGPAGSGKTTLVLHRVAYLLQSPDTAERFSADRTLILVQDSGTREYFSSLLPQLGIKGVEIATFPEWALRILGISDYSFAYRFGETEDQRDRYEYEKSKALKVVTADSKHVSIGSFLQKTYMPYLNTELQAVLRKQQEQKRLDRFDLTALLTARGQFYRQEVSFEQGKRGGFRRRTTNIPLRYSLLVLDEVQNYLAGQINILRSFMDEKEEALVYVGDLAQTSQLCTIKDLLEIGGLSKNRRINLHKVYRNTKQILEFIRSWGYTVDLPNGLREGKSVLVHRCDFPREEIAYISGQLSRQKGIVGILAKRSEYLKPFRQVFSSNSKVKIFSINEAQGVEFDTVFIVGVSNEYFSITGRPSETELVMERMRVDRDLLYIALTRAMNELHVLGDLVDRLST